jgi:hypothetical protein
MIPLLLLLLLLIADDCELTFCVLIITEVTKLSAQLSPS